MFPWQSGFQHLLSFLLVGIVYEETVLTRPVRKVDTLSRKLMTLNDKAGQNWAGNQIIHDIFEVVCVRMIQFDVHVFDLGQVANEFFKRLQSNF